MLESVTIRTPFGIEVARLRAVDYWEPTWAHPRSAFHIVYFDLLLPSGAKTKGRYFTDKLAVSDHGRYVAIQACHVESGPEDIDKHNMELFVLDLNNELELRASGAKFGHVIPVGFEGDNVVYQKSQVNSELATEYEVSLGAESPWRPIGDLQRA